MQVTGLRVVPQNALRRMGVLLVALAAVLGALLLLQEPAHAGDSYTWTGEGGNSSWTNSCNWWPKEACQEKYPGKENPDDTATIAEVPGGPSAVSLGENITLATLNLDEGGPGSSITGGSLTLTQGLNWTGGDLTTEVTLTANSVGTVGGSDLKKLDGEINNGGRLTLDSGILTLANAAKINNAGTFGIAKGSQVQGQECCLTPPEIKSTGTLEVGSFLPIPGADTATIDNVSLDADNIVDVGGGVLELRQATTSRIDAGTIFMGDGKVRVMNKAKVEMAGAFSVSDATEFELYSCPTCFNASLTGTGTMKGSGTFLWTGGDVNGNLTLGQQIGTRIEGPANKNLNGKITNLGRAVFAASAPDEPATGPLRFGGGASLTNSGIFIADERVEMVGIGGCCSPPVVANFYNTAEGVFTAAAPGGTPEPGITTVRSMGFRAGGLVHVESGALELRSGVAKIPAGSKINGTGSVVLTEGQSAEMAGAFEVGPEAELEIGSCTTDGCSVGRLVGVGTLGGGGRLEWVSGNVGTGTTGAIDDLTIAQGSKLALTGSAPKQLQAKLTNRGTATLISPAAPAPATGPLQFSTNGRFVNAATFYLDDRAVLDGGSCCGDGSADLVNLGKIAMPKSLVPGKGSVAFESLIFENRGTVELASGTLRLGRLGGYRQLSGSTRLVGGRLASDGVTLNLDGGTLAGTGTVSADVRTSSGGTVAPGAPGTAGSTGILKIVGNYGQHQGGVLNTDIKGATPGSGFDQLQVTGTALLVEGTLDLDTARGYVPGTRTELKMLTAGQVSGAFGLVKDAGLPNGRQWRPLYNSSNVTLWVMTP